jgi:hypothetical protein
LYVIAFVLQTTADARMLDNNDCERTNGAQLYVMLVSECVKKIIFGAVFQN